MYAYVTLYPEVVRAGSLRNVLRAAADRAGHGLVVGLTSSPGWRYVAARVESDGHRANAHMALSERCFIVDCGIGDVRMASGSTPDLTAVVETLHSWLRAPGSGNSSRSSPF
ncbi:hypothetical protein CW362_30585 [Streptomyces populi]|uniref:Uncharacterized protein n=2 Tax=Streptomyces populi TaxID=2058924 RepID=A0A2I0SH99_9ACTN|nr:hypothetical protein CW362_30585 [Streptomyces populi]